MKTARPWSASGACGDASTGEVFPGRGAFRPRRFASPSPRPSPIKGEGERDRWRLVPTGMRNPARWVTLISCCLQQSRTDPFSRGRPGIPTPIREDGKRSRRASLCVGCAAGTGSSPIRYPARRVVSPRVVFNGAALLFLSSGAGRPGIGAPLPVEITSAPKESAPRSLTPAMVHTAAHHWSAAARGSFRFPLRRGGRSVFPGGWLHLAPAGRGPGRPNRGPALGPRDTEETAEHLRPVLRLGVAEALDDGCPPLGAQGRQSAPQGAEASPAFPDAPSEAHPSAPPRRTTSRHHAPVVASHHHPGPRAHAAADESFHLAHPLLRLLRQDLIQERLLLWGEGPREEGGAHVGQQALDLRSAPRVDQLEVLPALPAVE